MLQPKTLLRPLLGIAALVLVWELVRFAVTTPNYHMPGVWQVMAAIPGLLGSPGFLGSFALTLFHIVVCCSIAIGAGTILGYFFQRNEGVYGYVRLPLDFLRSVPAILVYYLLIALIGLSPARKMALIGLYLALPHSVYVFSTLVATDQRYSFVARALRIPSRTYQWQVLLPASLPGLVGAARVVVSWCVVLVLVFELFTAGFGGVGAVIYHLSEEPEKPALPAAILLVGTMGYGLNLLDSIMRAAVERRWR